MVADDPGVKVASPARADGVGKVPKGEAVWPNKNKLYLMTVMGEV